ncbi:hypothetical protein HS99_0018615 [Kitasatospora aureofaciens]|uniref:Uncharacterized protein n=1 Tax=Kitasatospora aureofaciens TaxID=1894 RepID=A0A1E7NEH2_KITAU|nr:hypothetical protein HS99_0018615 [Kitasatospora aureofaciens]GGV04416.1 hypothetical protein GCM10010502_68920 [Kitasatospora aureofaciens]
MALPEVGQEVLELGCVVPAVDPQVGPKLVERLGVGGEFGVSDLADEGGRVVAVDEPVRVLPGVKARGAAGDVLQGLLADAVESV